MFSRLWLPFCILLASGTEIAPLQINHDLFCLQAIMTSCGMETWLRTWQRCFPSSALPVVIQPQRMDLSHEKIAGVANVRKICPLSCP